MILVVFQHGGAPLHYSRKVRNYLDNNFLMVELTIELLRNGQLAHQIWLPLTLWGYLKQNIEYIPESKKKVNIYIDVSLFENVHREISDKLLCQVVQGNYFRPFPN